MASISEVTTEQRLEKVERELGRARWRSQLLVAVMLLAFVLLAVGATTPGTGTPTRGGAIGGRENIIRANRFILEDENGKTRALLAVGKEGPGLLLYDENGKTRAQLVVVKDGPRLTLFDENGKCRADLFVVKDGPGPTLCLFDHNEKLRAALGITRIITSDGKVSPYPESFLSLFKPDGNVLWQAPP